MNKQQAYRRCAIFWADKLAVHLIASKKDFINHVYNWLMKRNDDTGGSDYPLYPGLSKVILDSGFIDPEYSKRLSMPHMKPNGEIYIPMRRYRAPMTTTLQEEFEIAISGTSVSLKFAPMSDEELADNLVDNPRYSSRNTLNLKFNGEGYEVWCYGVVPDFDGNVQHPYKLSSYESSYDYLFD